MFGKRAVMVEGVFLRVMGSVYWVEYFVAMDAWHYILIC